MRSVPLSAPEGHHARCTPRRFLVVFGLAVALVVALVACDGPADPQQIVGRSHFVSDLANRVTRGRDQSYTATYQLPGGVSAVITQGRPGHVAYTYPGGRLVLTSVWTADCRTASGSTACTLISPSSPGTSPGTGVLTRLIAHGLVPATTVAGLLTSAALDGNAVVKQHDTTIIGENATCVDVSGVDNAPASQFSTCITIDGMVGSFKGTVNGVPIEMSLGKYDTKVALDAFDLPAGAKVTDQRPK